METINRVYVAHADVITYCAQNVGTTQEDAARALAKRAGLNWPGDVHYSPDMEGWCVWIRRDRFDRPHRESDA